MADSTAIAALKEAFRDYVTDDVPASGANEPDKAEIRDAFTLLGVEISSVALGLDRYATVAAMDAVTTSEDGQLAYVYANNGDPDDPANGFYQWDDGASDWVPAPWFFDSVAAAVQDVADAAAASAAAAAASAAAAAASAGSIALRLIDSVYLYDADGIPEGGAPVEVYLAAAATIDRLYASVEASTGTASFDSTVLVDGVVAYGPATATNLAVVNETGLAIDAAEGSTVTLVIHNVAGSVTAAFIQIDGTFAP